MSENDKEIETLPERIAARVKASLIGNHCTSPDGTMVHEATAKVCSIAAAIGWQEVRDYRDALTTAHRERDEALRQRDMANRAQSADRRVFSTERDAALAHVQRAEAMCNVTRDLRNAANEAVTNGGWTLGEQCGDWVVTKEVYETVREAVDDYDALLGASNG